MKTRQRFYGNAIYNVTLGNRGILDTVLYKYALIMTFSLRVLLLLLFLKQIACFIVILVIPVLLVSCKHLY